MKESLRLLLANAIDYAGLFPPANLDMQRAASNYAEYLNSGHVWMLGCFVVPASHLAELRPHLPEDDEVWRVSAVVGEALPADVEAIERFNENAHAKVEWLEARVTSADRIRCVRGEAPSGVGVYFELGSDDLALMKSVREAGSRAKIRTGGVVSEAIPATETVARFIACTAANDVAFKATAGLHHALRSEHALTGEEGSPRATMHGFLNLLLASVFVRNGSSVEEIQELLDERSPEAFRFDDDGITWRYQRVSNQQIRRARETSMVAFGSCSFTEPVDELRALALL